MIRIQVRTLAAGAICLLLAGCFDIAQRFSISDNGTAVFNYSFAFDTAVLDAEEDGVVDADGSCQSDDIDAEIPEGLTRVSEVRTEGSLVICDYAVSGPLAAFEGLRFDVDSDDRDIEVIAVEILDDDRLRLVSVYNFADDDFADEGSESAMERSIKRMIAANFEGRSIRWTVEAPTILESNGEIAADGRSVTWELPLEKVIEDGGSYRFEAIVDYRNHRPRFF